MNIRSTPETNRQDLDWEDGLMVAVGQFASVADTRENVARIEGLTARAAAAGARLIAFPEAASYAFSTGGPELGDIARQESGLFREEMARIALKHEIALIVGMYDDGGGALSDNVLLALGPDGALCGRYHKLHLYDAFTFRESEKNTIAQLQPDFAELVTIDIGPFRFGLVNCYDLRFPEMARALVQRGANVLVVCAGWIAGPLKELHWELLLRARAIENTSYVIAASQPAPLSAGLSMAVDPSGLVLGTVAETEGIALARLSLSHLTDFRRILPCLEQRRYHVVQG
ncbi:nitrilase-related carbon-nitrogen hydrolase [Szabonella alba]|uniref:CN hydrolase domain-containing protein n=1 Tax=Szabonella alba TaxID=2804194 RepID=A0A8K0Y286_9RHOB|nr:nitrilase-related carbon-nitrogen hydrolase [Szabonella alba]MBL4919173.1 hypothetical protein [Szabonella alba]